LAEIGTWSSSSMFFIDSASAQTITVDLEFEITANNAGSSDPFISIYIQRLNFDGVNHNTTTYQSIDYDHNTAPPEKDLLNGVKHTYNVSYEFDMVLHDELAFVVDTQGVDFTINKINTVVSSVLSFTETNPIHKFHFAHNVIDKVVTIISNKENVLKSNFFGKTDDGYTSNGEGSYTGLISGLSLRNFLKGADRYKALTISFKDLYSSLDAVWNIGMGIEKINNKYTVVIEDKKYFYQNYVAIELGEVYNLEEEVNQDAFYNELEFGYQKSGGYEQDMGIDEPSAKSNFSTSVEKIKNKYSSVSKVRNDSYGKTFAIRKEQTLFGTEDTKYDEDNWFLDVKDLGGGQYTEKTWQDRFTSAPTGVFSVDTLTGAYFSPVNNLLRHSWWFSQGFEKDLEKYVRFVSSTGNSDLVTETSGVSYSEKGDILNFTLERPLLLPKVYKFNKSVNSDLMDLIEGRSTVNGVSVPNVNCMFSFTFNGNTYYGYMNSLKPLGKGDWGINSLKPNT